MGVKSIEEIISLCKTAFQAVDFAQLEVSLVAREDILKQQVESIRKENELIQQNLLVLKRQFEAKSKGMELLQAKCMRHQLEVSKLQTELAERERESSELKQSVSRLRGEHSESKDAISELKRENNEMQLSKSRLENELQVWRKKYAEFEERVLVLEKDFRSLKSEEPPDSTMAVKRPRLGDVVEIVDSDDDSAPREGLNVRRASSYGFADKQSDEAVIKTEVVMLEGNGDSFPNSIGNDSVYNNSSSFKANNCSTAGKCQNKCNALVLDSLDVDDDSSWVDSEDDIDPMFDFSVFLQRDQGKKDPTKWKLEKDMVAAFERDIELCMKAVCALYRQETGVGKSLGLLKRGFMKINRERDMALAEFLVDGDQQGKLKKSVEELLAYDPDGLDSCKRIAIDHSAQLFELYQQKEDPLFLE
ncbi:hypothetical protein K2173_022649 [Erythroxylum novogranatense]|uniref:FRIGIDA-like protein n=1 Tax=Erythroxylum novogranatense TaxID=1862640 RepID=A0AAV8TRV4_9ROSI|nr:hypothetical protein K2173_022649 [Erythroxylum novogranatense]